MGNYKNNGIATGAADANGQSRPGYQSTLRNGRSLSSGEGRDVAGWDSYNRWLSRVQGNERRRSAVDPALYTWKGYRNWSDKVRRDWKQED